MLYGFLVQSAYEKLYGFLVRRHLISLAVWLACGVSSSWLKSEMMLPIRQDNQENAVFGAR